MSGIATAIAGSAIIGGIVSSHNANNAASAQSDAAQKASDNSQHWYDLMAGQVKPYQDIGEQGAAGIAALNSDPNSVQNDPGYQFRLQQGLQALQRSAAAKGGLLSGGTLKGITDYSQGAASQEYGNAWNRQMGLVSTGLSATNALAGQGANTMNQQTQDINSIGNANSANAIANGNAWSSAINGLGNAGIYGALSNTSGSSGTGWNKNPWGGSLYNVPGMGGTEYVD